MITVREVRNAGRNKLTTIKGDTYFLPVVDGVEYSHIGETEDVALLIGLGIKYEGLDSKFAKMATRMLNIDSVWAK